jgi:predicted Zn-dependent protease
VVERFPDDAPSLGHLAAAHLAARQPDHAEALLQAGLERFPHNRDFARTLVRLALDRRDAAAAAHWRDRLVDRLQAALALQPDSPDLLIEFVNAMAEVPQADWPIPATHIEHVLQAAAERGSQDVFLHVAYAAIAAGRADWPEQHRRLADAAQRLPDDPLLRTRLAAAREIMLAEAEAPPPDRPSAAASGIHPDLPPGELVLHFESLGGGGANEEGWGFGCEFGYFQRECGEEPLSLLRWASIGPKNLIRALDEDLAGFGDIAALNLSDHTGEDWGVDETIYHSRFDHTHLSRANVPWQEARRLVALRMRFLARKLLGDLQAGEKLFVYRVINRVLGEAAILRLAQAVNRHGNNVLLFVALADADHPAFTVRHVHPGLMIGYIDFFRARGGEFREWNHTGWLRLCREAVRVLQEAAPEHHGFPPVPADWEAAALTEAAQRRIEWEAIFAAAQQASEAGDHAESERQLRLGAERYPEVANFPHDLARLAERRADWPDAEHWWRQFTSRHSHLWWAHTALADALRRQGRRDAAEAVLLAAHEALPAESAILLDYARLAEQAGDWAEAERRFARLADRFPDVADGLLGQAIAAREQGRGADAEQLLRQGAERHPQVAGFPHDLARLAEQRRDWPAAEQAWRRFLAIDPGPWWAHNALARARLAQGARSDAVAILQARYTADAAADPHGLADAIELLGAALEPTLLPLIAHLDSQLAPHVATATSAHVGLAYAHAACFLENFDAYRSRAEALAARFPHEGFVREALHAARELAPRDEDLRAASLNQALLGAAAPGAGEGFHDTDWLRFESLGGGGIRGGCEFGLLQRSVGEPLSLLRWASIEPEQLADALERRFEGLGNPATLSIETQGHYDWKAIETIYNIRMDHTHLDRQTVSRETAARQVLTRLKFLSRKLINDLGEGEKIFLYRLAGGVPDDVLLQRLSRAIAAYGPSRLLVVGEDAALRDGIDYRAPAANLLLAVRPDTTNRHGLALDPRRPGWRQICEQALLWQQGAFHPPARLPYPGEGAAGPADGADTVAPDFGIACMWARQATEARDWTEAQRRWALVSARFPAEPDPVWQEGVALREAGAPDEAAARWQDGAARFPRETGFAHELARLAEGRADWPEAERWWRAFLDIQPALWWAHTGLAHALTQQDRVEDAEAVLQAAQDRLPAEAAILLGLARLAERRRDWPEAEQRFARLCEHFPDAVDGPWGRAAALREQGRLDEAEQLLREGAARHPSHGGFVHDLARLAEWRGDWPAAERLWRDFLALEPHFWWAHTSLANALLAQHRADEAEAVLRDARAALPDEIGVVIELAHLIERDAQWAEALALWTLVRAHAPDDLRGHLHSAHALRALGRAEEADAVLQAAVALHPAEPHLLHSLARAAEWRQDWAAAERGWHDLLAIDPGNWEARRGIAAARCERGEVAPGLDLLAELAHEAGADPHRIAGVATLAFQHAPSLAPAWLQSLAEALARAVASGEAPASAWLAHALVAKRHERFGESRARLEQAAARHPDDLGIRIALADACELAPQEGDAAAPHAAADAALLRHFESLSGNWGGCEFGFFQRAHGFEPLSLLRWASIEPEALCRLLEQQFSGLGAADTVSLRSQGHPDWQAVELTYGIQMDHTHLDRRTVTIETATRLVRNMLTFLARKLADDLRLGEKVFVYRMSGAPFPPALVGRLEAALAGYGPGRLLLVGERSPARVERLSPRCLEVLREPLGTDASESVRQSSWQAILREAAQAFDLKA